MSRITIKDIARKLNINPSTVSRALRDHPDVGIVLRQTIKKLADELGYSPNQMAINLRKGKTYTIALIIPEISMFFFPSVVKAVEELAHEKGFNLMVLHSNDSIDREIENAVICANHGVDGVLVSLSRESSDLDHFLELRNRNIPIVYFDKVIAVPGTHQVVIPGAEAAALAIKELVKQAKTPNDILVMLADSRLSITADRLLGVQDAARDIGFTLANDQIVYATNADEAARLFSDVFTSKKPSGVFVMSDEILSGVIRVVNKEQIEGLPIVVMSDGLLPGLLPYPMGVVETSGYLLGQTACALLFNLMMGLPILPETHYIDVSYTQGNN